MIFKPMPQEAVLKALEGQEDVLTPAVEQHQKYFRDLACPNCQGSVIPILDPRHLYRENALLPNYLAECSSCRCQFEPYTKIQVSLPQVVPDSTPSEIDLLPNRPGIKLGGVGP